MTTARTANARTQHPARTWAEYGKARLGIWWGYADRRPIDVDPLIGQPVILTESGLLIRVDGPLGIGLNLNTRALFHFQPAVVSEPAVDEC